jgi:hypothetical protein
MSRQTLQKLIKRQFRGTQNVKKTGQEHCGKWSILRRKAWDMPTVVYVLYTVAGHHGYNPPPPPPPTHCGLLFSQFRAKDGRLDPFHNTMLRSLYYFYISLHQEWLKFGINSNNRRQIFFYHNLGNTEHLKMNIFYIALCTFQLFTFLSR